MADTVVVIPLGAESKEHGPHLKLKNDFLIAEYLKRRVLQDEQCRGRADDQLQLLSRLSGYPGSTSLRLETARDMIVDICRSLAKFGPSVSTSSIPASLHSGRSLRRRRCLRGRHRDALHEFHVTEPVESRSAKREAGRMPRRSNLDDVVHGAGVGRHEKGGERYHPSNGRMTRDPNGKGTYSPSGVWGDATLATREKGQIVTEALVKSVLAEVEQLRGAALSGELMFITIRDSVASLLISHPPCVRPCSPQSALRISHEADAS